MNKKSWFYYSFWLMASGFFVIMGLALWMATTKGFTGVTNIDAGQIQKMRAAIHNER